MSPGASCFRSVTLFRMDKLDALIDQARADTAFMQRLQAILEQDRDVLARLA